MDPKGKGIVVNDKEKESIFNEPRDDKPTDSGSSHKKKDGKKKRHIKKIVYYDSDESSSSQRDGCKENGPRAFWLIEFWCLMNNTIRELISFLVFVFVVHRMRRELDQGNEDETPQKKT
jgi:hypothetical protein